MRVGGVDLDERVLVVAEIGNNHEGDVEVAARLVELAGECGADAVKFQTFRTEHYVSRDDEERFARLERFRLTYDEFGELSRLAHERGLLFLSTPFDLESADFLAGVADAIKVASADSDFFPLLERVASSDRPLLLSSGLSDLEHVRRSVEFVRGVRHGDGAGLAVLHCVSSYPTPPEEAGLRAIPVLAGELGCTVGYSDHTVGSGAAPLAVALGARVVEKHFTLDKTYSEFRDHALSADPGELRELVRSVRAAETMLGVAEKRVQPSEQAAVVALRRSVVAARDLPAGHVLEPDDVTWVRPGGGLRPGEERRLLGRPLRRGVAAGERLAESDVAP